MSFAINQIFVSLAMFVLLFDPGKALGLKVFAIPLLVYVVFSALLKKNIILKKINIYCILTVFIILAFAMLNGVADNITFNYSTGVYFSSILLFLLLLFVGTYTSVDLLKALKPSLLLMVALTCFLTFLLYYNREAFYTLRIYFESWRMARITIRSIGVFEFLPAIFFTNSPLLVFLAAHSFYLTLTKKDRRSLVLWLIITLTLIFSGTRANIVASFLLPGMLIFILSKKILIKIFIILNGLILIVMMIYVGFLSPTDYSNAVKIGHFQSYISLFQNSSLGELLWGHGLGTLFFSSGVNSITGTTEFTILESIRMFGFLGTCFFYFFLVFPLFHLFRFKRRKSSEVATLIAYFVYFLMSFTNPLIFGSTGAIALSITYSTLKH